MNIYQYEIVKKKFFCWKLLKMYWIPSYRPVFLYTDFVILWAVLDLSNYNKIHFLFEHLSAYAEKIPDRNQDIKRNQFQLMNQW